MIINSTQIALLIALHNLYYKTLSQVGFFEGVLEGWNEHRGDIKSGVQTFALVKNTVFFGILT